ncbi:hypothetical protein [Fusobacterium varium]|uniref:hypothetical protein n=1 Tax=Fusobacterium varium TaxID=856 RepID=UPI0035671378
MKVKFIRNYKGFKKGDIEEILDEEELSFLDKTKTIEKLEKEIKLDIPVEEEITEKIEEDVIEKIDEVEKLTGKNKNKKK